MGCGSSGEKPQASKARAIFSREENHTLTGHESGVLCLATLGDKETLASGSRDNTIRIWDSKSGQTLHTLQKHTKEVKCLTVLGDGVTLVSAGADYKIALWDTQTGNCTHSWEAHSNEILALDVLPDGQTIISASRDSYVKQWDPTNGQQAAMAFPQMSPVTCLAVQSLWSEGAPGARVASGSEDSEIKIWDPSSATKDDSPLLKLTLTGHAKAVVCMTTLPNTSTLVSASEDLKVLVWNMTTGDPLFSLGVHTQMVSSLTVMGDGVTLVTASKDGVVKLWDTRHHSNFGKKVLYDEMLHSIEAHKEPPTGMAVLNDGWTLATGSEDGTVKMWESLSKQEAQERLKAFKAAAAEASAPQEPNPQQAQLENWFRGEPQPK